MWDSVPKSELIFSLLLEEYLDVTFCYTREFSFYFKSLKIDFL